MKNNVKIAVATMVAGLAIGVLAPLPAQANSAQIKVTHAVHKDTGTQAAARSATSKATAKKFRMAVMPAPHSGTSSQVNPAAPKFIRR
jgi:hypothetical protein